ncbi:MAG: hypothetical protein ACREMZ_11330 [Gemmatimonadales bacterium]
MPAAVLAGLEVAYLLVPRACRTGNLLPVHLTHLATLLLALTGGAVAWRQWQRWGASEDGRAGVAGFLAGLGLLVSAAFTLVSVALWLPSFVLSPCQ